MKQAISPPPPYSPIVALSRLADTIMTGPVGLVEVYWGAATRGFLIRTLPLGATEALRRADAALRAPAHRRDLEHLADAPPILIQSVVVEVVEKLTWYIQHKQQLGEDRHAA